MDALLNLKVQSFAMAKEKSTDKEERKREKQAKKEKRSERDGVHKSKKDKKEKHREVPVEDENDVKPIKLVEESTEVSVDAIMTEALFHKLGNQDPESDMKVATAEDVSSEPVLLGALVPFANPLADEKAQKKVLKSIKKGLSLYYGVFTFGGLHCLKSALLTSPVQLSPLALQRPKIDVSSVASKRSSSLSGNLPQQQHRQAANPHPLLFSQPIFLRWM